MSTQDKSTNRKQKQIFITGATGFIGRVVTEKALAEGYIVHGLSRSEKGDAILQALGATPVRGELSSLTVLRQESVQADIVLHLAYNHDFASDYEEILRVDAAAVDALSEPLRGTDKPLVISSGTAVVVPDPAGGETTEDSPTQQVGPLGGRIRSEQHALSLSEHGVRVMAIRLAPHVYGRGGGIGFVTMLMRTAARIGKSLYIDTGSSRTTAVHVDDAATLYLLVAKGAKTGDIFNGTSSTNVTGRELAEAIGEALQLPVQSATREEAEAQWGSFLPEIVHREFRASNRKAVERLGWRPEGIDMLSDIRSGSFQTLAGELRQK